MICSVKMGCWIFVLAVLGFAAGATANDMKMVCYYTNWAQYRPQGMKFFPENIDVNLCTHVMYAFAKISDGVLHPYEWNDESTSWSKGMYERTMAMKKQKTNGALKVLISVGGWNLASTGFSDVVASEANMNKFIDHSIEFMRDHGFDGLDMDWEYPGVRTPESGSKPEHKYAFTVLIQKLRAAFEAEAAEPDRERLLLTAAVGCGKSTIDAAYEVADLAEEMDFINLMTYDLHGGWERQTGAHTALYARDGESGNDLFLNVDWAVNYFMEKGLPADKLVMGMATYGRGFTLVDNSQTGMGAPATGPGVRGSYTRERGFLSYYEICRKLSNGWTAEYHREHKVMYAYGGNQWVAYDDTNTIGIKAQYIKDKGLAGGMIWALDLDDFKNIACGQGKYPLLNAIVNVFSGASPNTPATTEPATNQSPTTELTMAGSTTSSLSVSEATTPEAKTPDPTDEEDDDEEEAKERCQPGHLIAVPNDCGVYIHCTSRTDGFRMSCPPGLNFNPVVEACDWPANAGRNDC